MRLEDVWLTRSERHLLQDVSLQVVPGTLSMLVGPNGAGKSTLLKILSGDFPPDRGQVWINEWTLSSMSSEQQAQYRAVMLQHSQVNFPFSVKEIVAMGWRGHGGKDKKEALVYQAMTLAGINTYADSIFTQLSGGEQQRVQFSRAWLQLKSTPIKEPCYLLLDEPIASLDLYYQHQLLEQCQKLAQSGIGVVVVIHDLNLAALYADHIWLLSEGCLVVEGPPDKVLSPEWIHQIYGVKAVTAPHPYVKGKVTINTYQESFICL